MMKKKLEETGSENEREIPIEKSTDAPEMVIPMVKPIRESRPTRIAKFVRIVGSEVIVDVNGNGERIPYSPEKHSSLNYGDEIRI